jgi:microcystin-dependent protein
MYGLRYRGQLDSIVGAEFESLVAVLQEFLLKEHNEDGTHRPTESGLDFVPVGATVQWWTSAVPTGWLVCDGRAISRITYKRLFTVIGTTFGAGDGLLTFNLPDLRGRFPLGQAATGTGSTLGETGGTLDHTHGATIDAAGAHTHTVDGHTHTISSDGDHAHGMSDLASEATSTAGGNNIDYTPGGSTLNFSPGGHAHFTSNGSPPDTDDAGAHSHSGATGSTSPATDSQGSHSHTGSIDANNPPFIVGQFIILAGV